MRIAACLVLAALLAGCTTHADGPSAHQTASGAAGGGNGDFMDRQEAELRLQLASEHSQHEVEIERVRDDMLRLTLANEVSFDTNSAVVKPTIAPTLAKVAEVLARYQDSRVTIVAHTDSTGSGDYNRFLSRDRAVAVLEELTRLGVPADRLIAFGRGESEPRSDNATSDGRARNRRVEILLTAA
jgi:outer membrane protein OmpA-like peptidoglycan-associated protein